MSGNVTCPVLGQITSGQKALASKLVVKHIPRRKAYLYPCALGLFNTDMESVWIIRYKTNGQRSALIESITKTIYSLGMSDTMLASAQRICLGYSDENWSNRYDMLSIATAVVNPVMPVARRVDARALKSWPEFRDLAIQNAAMISFDLKVGARLSYFWARVKGNLAKAAGADNNPAGIAIENNVCNIVLEADEIKVTDLSV